jgi:flagellar biosynthetic protein FliR
MTFDLPTAWLAGFLLALARSGAWAVVAPPFNANAVPVRVRVAFAVSLSLVVAPELGADAPTLGSPAFVMAALAQLVVGLALGFLVFLALAVVQSAGQLIDLVAGFGMAQMYDPLSNASTSPVGRFYQLLTTTLLFAINGHVVIVRGFLRSFEAVPAEAFDAEAFTRLLTTGVSGFLVSAVQVALPLCAALFLADVALALVSRAAPRLEILSLSIGAKALIVLVLGGLALPLLPQVVRTLVERAAGFGL